MCWVVEILYPYHRVSVVNGHNLTWQCARNSNVTKGGWDKLWVNLVGISTYINCWSSRVLYIILTILFTVMLLGMVHKGGNTHAEKHKHKHYKRQRKQTCYCFMVQSTKCAPIYMGLFQKLDQDDHSSALDPFQPYVSYKRGGPTTNVTRYPTMADVESQYTIALVGTASFLPLTRVPKYFEILTTRAQL